MKIFRSTENLGKTAVQRTVDLMGCIYRPLDKDDVGIDAHIELVQRNGNATGKLIAVQVKSGNSYLKPWKDGYSYYGTMADLIYWRSYSCPVILAVYHPEGQIVYWKPITSQHIEMTEKGFRVDFDGSDEFDVNCYGRLLRLAGAKCSESEKALQLLTEGRRQEAVAILENAGEQLDDEGLIRLMGLSHNRSDWEAVIRIGQLINLENVQVQSWHHLYRLTAVAFAKLGRLEDLQHFSSTSIDQLNEFKRKWVDQDSLPNYISGFAIRRFEEPSLVHINTIIAFFYKILSDFEVIEIAPMRLLQATYFREGLAIAANGSTALGPREVLELIQLVANKLKINNLAEMEVTRSWFEMWRMSLMGKFKYLIAPGNSEASVSFSIEANCPEDVIAAVESRIAECVKYIKAHN